MSALKKHLTILKLNRQIHQLDRDLAEEGAKYGIHASSTARETEKSVILRESMNRIIHERNKLRSR